MALAKEDAIVELEKYKHGNLTQATKREGFNMIEEGGLSKMAGRKESKEKSRMRPRPEEVISFRREGTRMWSLLVFPLQASTRIPDQIPEHVRQSDWRLVVSLTSCSGDAAVVLPFAILFPVGIDMILILILILARGGGSSFIESIISTEYDKEVIPSSMIPQYLTVR